LSVTYPLGIHMGFSIGYFRSAGVISLPSHAHDTRADYCLCTLCTTVTHVCVIATLHIQSDRPTTQSTYFLYYTNK